MGDIVPQEVLQSDMSLFEIIFVAIAQEKREARGMPSDLAAFCVPAPLEIQTTLIDIAMERGLDFGTGRPMIQPLWDADRISDRNPTGTVFIVELVPWDEPIGRPHRETEHLVAIPVRGCAGDRTIACSRMPSEEEIPSIERAMRSGSEMWHGPARDADAAAERNAPSAGAERNAPAAADHHVASGDAASDAAGVTSFARFHAR